MKRKLLSVLLALTMMLTLLPVSALAVDLTEEQKTALEAQGYSAEQIAELEAKEQIMVISEDTVLEEDYEGLVLVVGKCSVTVRSAKVGVGVVVLPGAQDAKVVLEGSAEVNAVVVLDKAEVVIEAEAQTTYVTVAAPEAAVTVSGAVEKLTVDEAAQAAQVTVAENATVAAVTVSAPEVKAEIAGTVSEVAVTETAAGASVVVAENATVSTLAVAAPDVKADVAGTVESVTVAETATGAELAVAETAAVAEVTDNTGALTVSGDGAANVTVTDTTAEPAAPADEDKPDEETKDEETKNEETKNEETATPPFITTEKTVSEKVGEGIGAAPLDDHTYGQGDSRNGAYTSTSGNGADVAHGLAEGYNVTSTQTGENTYDVHVVGTNVLAHGNSANQGGCWVGIAIPVEEGYSYTYCRVQNDGTKTETTNVSSFVANGTNYETFYWSGPADENGMINREYVYEVTMKNDATDEESVILLNIDVDIQGTMVDGHLVWTGDDYSAWLAKQQPAPTAELAEVDETEKPETPAPEAAEGETVPAPETPVAPETPAE